MSAALLFSLSAMQLLPQDAFATAVLPKELDLAPQLLAGVNSGPQPSTGNFNLTDGYSIEPVLWNLSLPSAVTFDGKGNIFVAEAGYAPGGLEAFPRILKVDTNGTISTLSDRVFYPPITDIQYHEGKIYVSNRGKISIVDAESGKTTDLIMGLRNLGDHRTNQIAFGPDGRMYFGTGSATNSGVAGEDNYEWLRVMPTFYGVAPFYDVPGKNITLSGQNFESSDIFTPVDPSDTATTGAFVPFGNSTTTGQQIIGDERCTACIVSAKPDGTDLQVVAWGMRNPYGLVYDTNSSRLLVSSVDADERGSRPIANDSDKVYSVNLSNSSGIGNFYGWPDFFGNAEPVTSGKFQSNSSSEPLQFLMQDHPPVEKPLALVDNDVTATQIALSNNSNFGFKGMAFMGEFGPESFSVFGSVGVPSPDSSNEFKIGNGTVGQKIVMFDPDTGNHTDFLTLKQPDPGFRPAGVEFTHDGSALYVVSVGKVEVKDKTPQGHPLSSPMPWYHKHTGVLWRITNSSTIDQGLAGEQEITASEIHLSPEMKDAKINAGEPPTNPDILYMYPGYKIRPVLWNLDKPGSFAFDDRGNMYVASTGITYGKQTTTPAIYKIDANGTLSVFVDRPLHGILSDIEFNKDNGLLYVAHRNVISTVNLTSGIVNDLVNGMPTSPYVTHPMGQLAFGPDGRLFFNVGGLSNLAVPDISDYGIGWIAEMPFMHEVPAIDIRLNGVNFQSDNFLTAEPDDTAITGGFRPFGVPAYEDQLIRGDIKCTACVYSINPDGTDLKVHAWGARSVYGMAFDDKGRLHWTNNGNDDKGIRRVTSDPDTVSVLDVGKDNLTFFGWPDYMGMGEPITAEKFNQSPVQQYPNMPLVKDLPPVTEPLVNLGAAVAATQVAFSTSDEFGLKGRMFLGEFGTSAPIQHVFQEPQELSPGEVMGRLVGQKVIAYDPDTGSMINFIAPTVADGSFRPVGLQFSPDGGKLYIASIEIHEVRQVTPSGALLSGPAEYPYAMSGVIWEVSPVNGTATGE